MKTTYCQVGRTSFLKNSLHTTAALFIIVVYWRILFHNPSLFARKEDLNPSSFGPQCGLKNKLYFSTITRRMIARDPRKDHFPEKGLEQLYHFNSCAVVSSSHALKHHQYGAEIDKHDCVLRFNCAPTTNFEQHVGSRTDIRLINTQIPSKTCGHEFWNDSVPMFNHEIIVVRHNGAIRIIDKRLDTALETHGSLPQYIRYTDIHKDRQLFLHDHVFGARIKRELKEFSGKDATCKGIDMSKSPSSGLFGVLMLLHLCDWVYVYEIVPSDLDPKKFRYYYDETILFARDARAHPFSTEHQFLTDLSMTRRDDVRKTGVLVLRGFSQC